ncbi:alginate lyase family protein [uncultured Thiodictyon sp.]|uniref:heparinase II/III family protein n=1 Tax=uncultured Thiodictyon sp. TaxID=1846217 RepID=UPI0025D3DDFB|nr:alginate lyase family protein [uncultured Thiodictyon sp.]
MLRRYFHTLRHLRPVQFYGRVWFRLYRPHPDTRPAPPLRRAQSHWVAPALRPVSLLGPASLRLLNETHALLGPGAWNNPARDKLWLYNLHYFDDLSAATGPQRVAWQQGLLRRWVAENPPGVGTGWEPYPTSLRIVNWVKWSLAGNALPPECVASLAVQARWLRRRLEHHLLGNHLLANAKALAFAGAFFAGPQAQSWRARAERLLARELREQTLADGGHFERSPMYHAIVLEDVLDLINLVAAYPETAVPAMLGLYRECVQSMTRWLTVMCHPDGEIGFFNDAALGIAPTLAQLVDYRQRLGLDGAATTLATRAPTLQRGSVGRTLCVPMSSNGAVVWLRDSGYCRLEAGSAVALLDVAPLGADYLPGHAHADTLSFELSLFGQRVIVNGGTSRYGSGPERLAQRGTAAHSTVQIDGADSSEVWGGFRVARRARPLDVRVDSVPELDRGARRSGTRTEFTAERALRVCAAHDGYRRLPGRPLHRRTWELTSERLTVTDAIEGECGAAVARFHLHPEVIAEIADDGGRGCLRLPGGHLVDWQLTGGHAGLASSVWHPAFGRAVPTRCLELRFTGHGCRFDLDWREPGVDALSR